MRVSYGCINSTDYFRNQQCRNGSYDIPLPRSHGAQNCLSPTSANVTFCTSGADHSATGDVGVTGELAFSTQPTDAARGEKVCVSSACVLVHGTSWPGLQTTCETTTVPPTRFTVTPSALIVPCMLEPPLLSASATPRALTETMAPLSASTATETVPSVEVTVRGGDAAA